MSQARPGRLSVRWNLAGWVRLRPVIRIYHKPVQARSPRPGPARPCPLAPPGKTDEFEISEILEIRIITDRDLWSLCQKVTNHDIFVRNGPKGRS